MPLVVPEPLRDALTKPVAVFGSGLSGQGVLALLRVLGLPGVCYDEREMMFTPAHLSAHRLVVFSPGFPADHAWLKLAREGGLECLGEMDFAALFWKGRVIAITGTNGKTTLTEFLTHALRQEWETAHAVGNIGRPFARLVADTAGGRGDDIAICEVSSFQAETMRHFRCEAVLWTNFAEDHLDRHADMKTYFDAKWKLVANAGAQCICLGPSVRVFAAQFGHAFPAAAIVVAAKPSTAAELKDTVFADYPQRENFELALAWWKQGKRRPDRLYAAAQSFRLGRHRMGRVAEIGSVTYWNDSKGTNFHAVEGALRRFDQPVTLILGGKAKGGDLAAFVNRIAPQVRHALLIGEIRTALAAACDSAGMAHTVCASLEHAVSAAAELTASGGHVVLSPGFASFDMFRNYEERGEIFERLVQSLGKTANMR